MTTPHQDGSLPLTSLKKIDALCRRFEAAWKEGRAPDIETFLAEVDEAEREALFRELLQVELHYRSRQGERISPEDYLRRFPAWEPVVLASFGTVLAERLKSESRLPPAAGGSRPGGIESTWTFDRDNPLPWLDSEPEVGAGKLVSGEEPVPGYKLLDPLGKGGFGEVWKACGPGEFEVAFKFVSLWAHTGTVERQALSIIQQVRHPGLLSIFGTWQTANWLIIGMELADRTLAHRFEEAVREGTPGIARKELLSYMLETARILDYLNKPRHFLKDKGQPVGIQHGDVKPQNIFLFGNGVKLGDFGLVSLLESKIGPHRGGLTFAYAAPEVLNGQISRWSDQFALAVTYCQMRAGKLPFTGTTRSTVPDLSGIPAEEREAILRALIVTPHDRWPNCRAFVKHLINSVRASETGVELKSGQRLGSYHGGGQLLERIGTGRLGEVWKATYAGGSLVAIRVVALGKNEDSSTLQSVLQKLLEEIHPSLARIIDFWIEDGRLFVVSELAERNLRRELDSYLTSHTPVPAKKLLAHFEGIARILDHLHSRGIRHGRITLENLLCVGSSTALADCYWGWRYQQGIELAPEELPEHVSPEGYLGKLTDASDQFSLALLYAQLRKGGPVIDPNQNFRARIISIVTHAEGARGREDMGWGMSLEEQHVVAKALSFDPSLRYPTCHSFIAELVKATADLPEASPRGRAWRADGASPRTWRTPPMPLSRSNSRGRLLWAGVVVLAGITLVSLLVLGSDIARWVGIGLGIALFLLVVLRFATRKQDEATPAPSPDDPLPATESHELHSQSIQAYYTEDGITSFILSVIRGEQPPQLKPRSLARTVFEEHIDSVWAVTFSPDGKLLLSGSMDNTMQMWDVWTGQSLLKLEGHQDGVTCVRFVGEGTALMKGVEGVVRMWNVVSSSLDGTIRLWNVTSGEETLCLRGHEGRVFSITVADDSRTLVSGGEDRKIRIWDLRTGEQTAQWDAHSGWVRCVLLSPRGGIISAGEDRVIRFWDVSGTEQRSYEGHRGTVTSLSIASDGALLASGSEDGTARIWDVETGEVIHRLEGHADWVRAVAFSPDGRFLLTGSDDEMILLWDATTGKVVCRYQGHAWPVLSVNFSPTDNHFASASDDCSVRLWKLPSSS